jgi:hypothetical protein
MNHMQISGVWDVCGIGNQDAYQFSSDTLALQFGDEVSVYENDRFYFVVDGELFDVSCELAMRDQRKLDAAYGYFAYVRYDKKSADISIGTDRFGYFPIYYAFENGRLFFGSTLEYVKSKLKHRSPDYEAWEELLVLGEVIGDKSTVKQVKRLSYGARIEIRGGKMTLATFWKPEMPEPPMDEGAYIRENNALLGEAFALTANNPKRKVVLLSGGEDSRRLAVGAVKQGLAVDFFTQASIYRGKYKVGVDRDVKLAAKVAEVLGRPHFIEAMPNEQQFLSNWKRRDNTLGYECIAHEWLLPLASRIEPRALIYDGIVGDIAMNGHYFKEFPQAVKNYHNVEALASMICGNESRVWLNELRRNTQSSLETRVQELLASYPESPHRLTYYFILNHTRRKISCVSQLFRQFGHSTCYPFLYYPLFMQSLRVDPNVMIDKFYQRECMAAQAAEVLSIPTTRESTLSTDWLIPMGLKARKQADCLLLNLTINDNALAMFPKFRLRYRVLQATKGISSAPLRKFGWFVPPISRFSSFLDWIDAA